MTAAHDPEFYLAHAGYVRALARRLVYDPHAADDLFQAAWLAALQRPPAEGSQPRRWLRALVRNLAIKSWLRNARRHAREQQAEPKPPVSSPVDVLAHESERQRVVAGLLALEEPYRTTLIMRFFDGLEAPQIAARLGVPVETVRTRLKRGLQRLRAGLLRDAALGAAMVRGLGLGPPGSSTAMAWFAHGVMVMSTAKKISVTIAAVVAVAFGAYCVMPGAANGPGTASIATPPIAETSTLAAPASATPPVGVVGERVAVASPPVAASLSLGQLAIHVQWADHRPAAGIGARIGRTAAANFEASVVEVRSDRAGAFPVLDLPAGQVQVELDRGVRSFADIRAGERTELALSIPAGVEIDGHVRDLDGRPAAGAQVYLVAGSFEHTGHVVATTADDGSFVIQDAPPQTTVAVSARAKGRASTAQQRVTAAAGAKVDIELVFAARGGAIVGTVVDAEQHAVAGAVIGVGDFNPFLAERKLPGALPPVRCRRASSDERGEFVIDGLELGDVPVVVVAAGFAPWHGEAHVVEGAAARCAVSLQAGVRMRGIVRDDRGTPVLGAELRVGQWGLDGLFQKSAADGSYELEGLPLGEFQVGARKDAVGEAKASRLGVSGVTLDWDPVLSRDTSLHGRIEAPGRPLAGFRVAARGMPAAQVNWFRDAETDATGRFEITNCPAVLLHLDVRSPTSGSCLVAMVDDVDALAGEAVITVDGAHEPTSHQHGRVVDSGGKPIADAELTMLPIAYEWGGGQTQRSAADGRFRSDGCPAGEWHLTVQADGRGRRLTAPRRLAAGEDLDWGDLVLPRGGSVVATVSADAGIAVDELSITIGDAWTAIDNEHPVQGVATFRALADGSYRLMVYGRDCAQCAAAVTVRDEVETAITLRVRRGIEVGIDVQDGDGRSVNNRVETDLFQDGITHLDSTPLDPIDGPLRWLRRLPPGKFELRLRDHLGRTAVLPFVVADEPLRLTATLR